MNRLKQIAREARTATGSRLHDLFFEVYGAFFGGRMDEDRARLSILTAVDELLERPANPGRENEAMEAILKQILAEMQQTNIHLAALVGKPENVAKVEIEKPAVEAAPPKRRAKKETVVHQTKGMTITEVEEDAEIVGAEGEKALEGLDGGPTPRPEVTLEELREIATRFTAAFGTEQVIEVLQKCGNEKMLSKVDPCRYAGIKFEMETRLAAKEGKPAPAAAKKATPAKALTKDEVKAVAVPFMEKNGEAALAALLKSFGAKAGLSTLDPSKYAAFVEAMNNA